MTKYRHWQNRCGPGDLAFMTMTVLDFALALASAESRDIVTSSLIKDCLSLKAGLRAYVVMPNHVHLLVRVPDDRDVSSFARLLKVNSSRRIRKYIPGFAARQIQTQVGLNESKVWKAGFRAIKVHSDAVRIQKINYIIYDPVRASLASAPEEYRWSSAYAFSRGLMDPEANLCLQSLLDLYSCSHLRQRETT